MNTVIEQMLRKYDSKNIYDQKNAMKEVMQEIVLYGLSRAGFFREAATAEQHCVFFMGLTVFQKIWIFHL